MKKCCKHPTPERACSTKSQPWYAKLLLHRSNMWDNCFYSGAAPGHGVQVWVLWLKVTNALAHVQTAAHIETAACPGVTQSPDSRKSPNFPARESPDSREGLHPCHQRWQSKAYDPQAHPASSYFHTSRGNGSTATGNTPNCGETGRRASGVKIQMGGWGFLNAILAVPPQVYD